MNFKQMMKPRHLYYDAATLTDTFGRFYAEPFHRGFGATIGNSLRRVLLSSIPGAAVTGIRIEGVSHEFMYQEGVREDVCDIILNLKGLRIKLAPHVSGSSGYIDAKGPKRILAKDIQWNSDVEILNPDHLICDVSEGGRLQMDVMIGTGIGYIPASEQKKDHDEIGTIFLDATFSPILNVRYNTESVRVGQITDYDRLIIEVTTNGAVRPDEAVSHAARILRDHLDLFVRPQDQQEEAPEVSAEEEAAQQAAFLEEKLDKSIEELELSVRSYNCLEAAGIKTIRDLVQKSEGEMLKYRNFGRKSLNEIKSILKEMNLSFNMRLDEAGMPVLSAEEEV